MVVRKGTPVFIVFFLTAFPCTAKAEEEGFYELLGLLSFSGTIESSNQSELGLDYLFGIGLNVPLLFSREVEFESYSTIITDLMIEPGVSVEYGFFSNLLRIRTGAHFGKCDWGILGLAYYAGLSGVFIKDFANGTVTFGISPEIGIGLYLLGAGIRLQAQYDFYTDERYNRFVFTIAVSFCIFNYQRKIVHRKTNNSDVGGELGKR